MCGFAGVIGNHDNPEALTISLRAMGAALAHRGPDDSGIWQSPDSGLGLSHQRLSVVDLRSRSRQPMVSQSGRYVIAYNGEVYNFPELRQTLKASGKYLRTSSDTEVVLEAIDQWGLQSALHRCVGMFAFALVDLKENILFLARDRMGEKPLYYGYQGKVFLFGSELRALRAHPEWRGDVSTDSVDAMLRLGYVPSPYSIYEQISKLEPGCIASLKIGDETKVEPKIERWWSYIDLFQNCPKARARQPESELLEEFESLFRTTIEDYSLADVAVGGFLSGGIDSSLVLAEMQRQSSRPVKSFTIGFEEASYDESPYAQTVAEHLGTEHQCAILGASVAQDLIPQIPEIYDEPFADPSQIPTILLSRLAGESVKVVVSGDGGDEIFGGYNRYIWGPKLSNVNSMLPISLRKWAASRFEGLGTLLSGNVEEAIFGLSPDRVAIRQISEKLRKLAEVLRAEDNVELYTKLVQQNVASRHPPPENVLWKEILNGQQLLDPGAKLQEKMMLLDCLTFLPDDILVKVDRASMFSSLEVRAPLLDHRIVEFAAGLPLSSKIKSGKGKVLLRAALQKQLGQNTVNRPKAGFALPVGRWLKGPLRSWAESVLYENKFAYPETLDVPKIDSIWKQFCKGENASVSLIWNILMFQAWHQRYQQNS